MHCTAGDELMLSVANRFYAGATTWWPWRWRRTGSPARSGGRRRPIPTARSAAPGEPRFPHVYGPLDGDAVVGARRLVRDGDGRYTGYASID